MSMLYFEDVSKIKFAWCGHSQAPSENWIHLSRTLANYELIVVTEGTLFIADHQREYAVNESEYLLMAPTLHQYGYRPGKCTFRWMHFEGTAAAYHEETGGEGKGRGIMMLEYGRLALADSSDIQ